jgi:ATP-binding cassette subfamily F protein 3
MLSLKNLKLAYGSKVLFENATINFYKGQKIGLVGQNGAGKTSLFKLLLGQLKEDAGEYTLSNGILLSYVEQEIEQDTRPLIEYVLSVHPLIKNEQTDLPEYYRLQPMAEKLLMNLGFKEQELYQPLNYFSGGWQMRANLAKALFMPSDLLLLDEPTNHLDVETVIWFEDWLKSYSGLLIVISHDREFLDNVTSHTLSIIGKELILYAGNYSTYEESKYLEYERHAKMVEKSNKKIAQLQGFVDKFKAKASKAKQAQSKVKMIEKLKITESLPRDVEFSIEFAKPEYTLNKLIGVENANFGYLNNRLIEGVNLDIFQSSRIGLLGRNGIGKSTFIKGLISGDTRLSGIVSSNSKIKIGYFSQNTVDGLDLEDTPLGFFISNNKNHKESELRAYLGRYGFASDKVNQKIKVFSGGEKARLVVADIIFQRPNLLFLDEPTNHLDMHMREELASAIQSFEGAVVIVSHDKFLLQSIVDEFYLIQNHRLVKFDGDLEDYHQLLLKENTLAVKKNSATKVPKEKVVEIAYNPIKLTHEIKKLEQAISQLNLKITECSNAMIQRDAQDSQKFNDYQAQAKKYNRYVTQLEQLEQQWLDLQAQLEVNGGSK